MPRKTMPRHPSSQRARNNAKAATADQPPAAAPLSTEELRRSLARKLAIFVSDWRRCPRRICQRKRECVPQNNDDCLSPRRSARIVTPEREAAELAHFLRAIKRRLAEVQSQ